MKSSQKLTPKYWVVHNPNSDDVILSSADKCRATAIKKWFESSKARDRLVDTLPEYYLEACGLECALVEVKLVQCSICEQPNSALTLIETKLVCGSCFAEMYR